MKAIVIKEAGGVDQMNLEETPAPECKSNEVLIENKAAGLNYIDIYFRTGLYPTVFPYIPGKEGSGIIAQVGPMVNDLKVGDRVAYCSGGSGSYGQYTVVPAAQVVKIPHDMSFELAAALMLQGLTAYYLTHITFPLKKGDTALIHAGAGGVGQLLIQVAKIIGAHVITTVSTDDKAKIVKALGADDVINYTQHSFLKFVEQQTAGNGVNVVYDAVGKTTFHDGLKCLGVRGMMVSYGQASGPIEPFDLRELSAKSLFLTRPTLFDYIRTKAELSDMSDKLFDLVMKHKLNIQIGQRYPLSDARLAHSDLENRRTVGKSILLI